MASVVEKTSAKATPHVVQTQPLQDQDAKWVSLKRITYVDPNGEERLWESCERKTRKGDVDAVIIFPVIRSSKKVAALAAKESHLREDDDRETVLVLQFRPAVGKIVVELPAGLIDANESAENAAIRELHEETGFRAKGTLMTSPIAYADPGLTNANCQFVFLEVDKDDERNQNPKAMLDPGEFIETVTVRIKDLLSTLEDYQRKGHAIDSRLMSFAIGCSGF